jgi:hypothetical protein
MPDGGANLGLRLAGRRSFDGRSMTYGFGELDTLVPA